MNDPDIKIEPLSPELEALISAAAGDDGPNEETAARLYSRLSSVLALPLTPTPLGAEQVGLAAKAAAALPSVKTLLASVLVASGLVGTAGYIATSASPAKAPNSASSPKEAPTFEAVQQHVPPDETLEKPQTETREQSERKGDSRPVVAPLAQMGSKRAEKSSEKRSAKYTMADERRLLDSARQALNQGKTDQALAHLARHRQQFKTGYFSEERDVLYIMSLSKKGQMLAAKRSAMRFFKKYPNTVFKDAVHAAVRGTP